MTMQAFFTTTKPVMLFAAMTIGASGAALAQTEIEIRTQPVEVQQIIVERPPGTVVIAGQAPVETMQLFKEKGFEDEMVNLDVIGAQPAGQAQELPHGVRDDLTSLRWSLPPGVLVMFYEDRGAKGEQLAIWGNGQIDHLGTFDFDNKATDFAWYYLGGANEPTQVVLSGAAIPVGAASWAASAPNSLQLFKSKNFKANTDTISPVTAQAPSTLHRLPQDLPDSLTSMRWNLPPGVVLLMHQDADGDKQQIAIWGSGQVEDLDVWDFNDKVSRWSWYYIGARAAPTLGYTPPTEPKVVVVDPPVTETKVIVVDNDAIDLVARSMVATELNVDANDLRAMKNPAGAGTFVYVPQTQFNGVERHVVWMVVDGKVYTVTGPAKMITPRALTHTDAIESTWSTTGLSRQNAEADSIRIVFVD